MTKLETLRKLIEEMPLYFFYKAGKGRFCEKEGYFKKLVANEH